ncbi:hypothetical protein PAMP_007438 [Pampus punctatissimus]
MTFTWCYRISNGYGTGSRAAGYYTVSLADIQSSYKVTEGNIQWKMKLGEPEQEAVPVRCCCCGLDWITEPEIFTDSTGRQKGLRDSLLTLNKKSEFVEKKDVASPAQLTTAGHVH